MSRNCTACVLKDKLTKENPNEYGKWKANQEPNCNANYDGSVELWRLFVQFEYLSVLHKILW